MARIREQDIERIKQEVSVERLAEVRGIRLDRHGADLIGLCPFHDDGEPSLVITPAKNLWHCLGPVARADHPSLAAPGEIVRKATTAAAALGRTGQPVGLQSDGFR